MKIAKNNLLHASSLALMLLKNYIRWNSTHHFISLWKLHNTLSKVEKPYDPITFIIVIDVIQN